MDYLRVAEITEIGYSTTEYRCGNELDDELKDFAEKYAGSSMAIEATGSYLYV